MLAGRTPGADRMVALRLSGDGALDPSFGNGGATLLDFDPALNAWENGDNLLIDKEGRIHLTGNVTVGVSDGVVNHLTFARLQPDGTPDPAFGEGGKARLLVSEQLSGGHATLDRAGRIVTVNVLSSGSTPFGGAAMPKFSTLMTRLGSNGTPDESFGTDGRIVISKPGLRFALNGVTTDTEGRYLFAGSEVDDTNASKVVLARYLVDYPVDDPKPGPTVKCGGLKATIVGDAKANRIKGTRKRDVIAGLGGNDTIRGLGGNDLICGGNGNDKLIGGPGRDKLIGGKGRDRLVGGPGKDRLVGGRGRDVCRPGRGKGKLIGCERRR